MNLREVVRLCLVCTLSANLGSTVFAQRDKYTHERAQMVEEYIAAEGVKNPNVLQSMRTVPRHMFVLPNLKHLAYYDQALDIGFKQTISPPFIVAYMTETLDPQPTDKVLEIGTGSGYQAAVLSSLVQDVYTIEIVEPLGKRAEKLLERLKYENVHCRVGDGYLGWPEQAPFDKIIVTCSPEDVPKPLVEQLKEGGRMIIPLGQRYQQVFYLFEKQNGELIQTELIPTLFVPMTGQMEELRKIKPDPLNPTIANGGFDIDENQDGLADNWHYQRRSTLSDDRVSGEKSIRFENDERGRMAHVLQGLAIDGSQVSRINLAWAMKSFDISIGQTDAQLPAIHIYFFDGNRIPIQKTTIGPWLADQHEWKRYQRQVDVPQAAREAIVQAGMNGATGVFFLDELAITPLH